MPHLEHDMDELFQKAAENYPLKTGDSDWERITARLKNESVVANNPVRPIFIRKKYLFALLLLLIALFLTNIVLITKRSGHRIGNTDGGKELNQGHKEPHPISSTVENKINRKSQFPYLEKEYLKDQRSEVPHSETRNEITIEQRISYSQYVRAGNIIIEPIRTASLFSLSLKTRNTPGLSIKNTNGLVKEKRFYWGILAGPQVNQVKQQGIQHTDVDAGIVVGYRINKKLAIESGLFYGEKCYYSDAKYFKMAPDPSMPANMTLIDLEGKSNVIGIPIKLRYDIINSRNNKFFAAAGLSSYLLTKENNNYHAMVNGSENFMEKSYNKNSCYAAANVNVSAGFEHRIIKNNFIRLEPYLQIPIKGIGVGSMPVTSAGIHIGIITNKRKR
jgi:hypothetical protein